MTLEQSYDPAERLANIRYLYVVLLDQLSFGDDEDAVETARVALEAVRGYQLCRAEGMAKPAVTAIEGLYAARNQDADILVADLAGSFWDALNRLERK